MNILFKAVYYLFILAVLAVTLLLLVSFVPILGIKVKVVKSGSMEPTIKTGSVVVIKPELDYKVGDVVTFGPDTKIQVPTTHRIIKSENLNNKISFITKGDANDSEDPSQIKKTDIIGKVIFTIPYAGFILDFAKKPFGFALLVGIPALSVIVDEVMNIITEIKRLRRRKLKENINENIS